MVTRKKAIPIGLRMAKQSGSSAAYLKTKLNSRKPDASRQ